MPDPKPGAAPEPAPDQDRRKISAPLNGLKGGLPPGTAIARKPRPPIPPVTPEQTANLIDQTAASIVRGEALYNSAPLIKPISDDDRRQLARFAKIPAEEFTTRLTTKLRALADLTADRIQQKLAADQFKPHELSFLLTVGVDKLQRLEGKGQLSGSSVNVQINNFAPGQSKADIIARLTGQVIDLPPSAPPPALAVAEEQAQYGLEPDPAPSLPQDESPD